MSALHQGAQVQQQALEVWVMDEHRIGLKPILRRVWAPRGQRPVVCVRPRYEWLYIYAFAHPNSGRSFYLLMPTVSVEAFSVALHEFATCLGLNDQQQQQQQQQRQVILLVDKAGWHISPKVRCPPGLSLRFLPAYSPELQPAEHLWQFTDAPLVNRCFDSLDQLEQVLVDHCCWLEQQAQSVRSATRFDWWPNVA